MGYGAFLLLALALFGPFDTYADYLFLVHMLQHLTLALAAAPLLLMAGVMPAFMWSMPRFLRQGVGAEFAVTGMARRVVTFATRPHVALLTFVGALWFWHIPDFYDAAVRNELIHLVEHLSFFLGALLFWWPIIGPAPVRSALSYPQRLLYLLMVVTPSAVLAALVTLAGSSIYESYDGTNEVWGLDPLSDQRIGRSDHVGARQFRLPLYDDGAVLQVVRKRRAEVAVTAPPAKKKKTPAGEHG